MRIAIVIALATLTGCTNGSFTPTTESKAAAIAADQRKAAARQDLFERCMNVSANLPRTSSDVAEIIKACDDQAWYSVQWMP